VIALIYRQDGGRRPEVIISDTGSYGDMVCGLMRLLGCDYRPQLADLPDAWNTVYLDAALSQLRAEGYPVLEQDVVRLSPDMRRRLNVHGDYSFHLPDLTGSHRAPRDPDTSDDIEDG